MSYYEAPLYDYDTGKWSKRPFETRKSVVEYLDSKFKSVGKYNIKKSHGFWNSMGLHFEKHESYPTFLKGTKDHKEFWDFEKEKCDYSGFIIYKSEEEDLEFCVPGLYYWYLNYTPIYDKIKDRVAFAEIWDSDLHYYLYILRCITKGRHAVILKKRQWGSSLKNTSILLNSTWFQSSRKNKMFAQSRTHVENSWKFLEGYRDHLNKHVGWIRGFEPNSFLDWQVRRKRTDGKYVGNMSILRGLTTEKDASKPVGGGISVLFGEESGINDSLDKTHEYALPAVSLGGVTTGLIIYAGSVGELERCEPLKNFMNSPTADGFLAVKDEWDDENLGRDVGFFAPEWWNYIHEDNENFEIVKCYDEWGNSNKEQALEYINMLRRDKEKSEPEKYRYFCSQRPLTIKEAFAHREESIFPLALIINQKLRIEKDRREIYVDLDYDSQGKIFHRILDKVGPVRDFPIKQSTRKEGCIVMYEPPDPKAKWGTYFAGVDPIMEGKSTTSMSLFSVYIYKNLIEEKTIEGDKVDVKLSGDQIVCCWSGRYDDVNRTNEVAEMLIEYYNAFTVVENNVDSFIKHMIRKKKTKYLARKDDLPFLRELNTNKASYADYGVRMNETIKTHIMNGMIEYCKEELGENINEKTGYVIGKIHGVRRIPDDMLLEEMLQYNPKLNTDRLIAFGLVLAFAKSRQANGVVIRKENIINPQPQVKIQKTPSAFKNLSSGGYSGSYKQSKAGFKNIR
jgi:hypothetical protein